MINDTHDFDAVPVERFHGADGRAVRPCTPAAVTRRHLRMLDLRPGMRVLDIGIGSGYSAALAAHLVGPEGHVTALEIDPGLAGRAAELYAEHGHRVEVVVGDGLLGHPEGAPYDRILVGTTPPAVPTAWFRQLAPGGALLAGVRVGDLPGAYAVAHISVGNGYQPDQVVIHHGGYTPMRAPGEDRRTSHAEAGDHSLTLATTGQTTYAATLLKALLNGRHTQPSPAPGDHYFHFKNWLIAAAPDGLCEATLPEGTGIGLAAADGAAILTDTSLVTEHQASPALGKLLELVHRWQSAGAPRTHEIAARLVRDGDTWHARLGVEDSRLLTA